MTTCFWNLTIFVWCFQLKSLRWIPTSNLIYQPIPNYRTTFTLLHQAIPNYRTKLSRRHLLSAVGKIFPPNSHWYTEENICLELDLPNWNIYFFAQSAVNFADISSNFNSPRFSLWPVTKILNWTASIKFCIKLWLSSYLLISQIVLQKSPMHYVDQYLA